MKNFILFSYCLNSLFLNNIKLKMSNLEITKIALKTSKRLYNHFDQRDSIKLMAREFIDVIKIILEDYDITKK